MPTAHLRISKRLHALPRPISPRASRILAAMIRESKAGPLLPPLLSPAQLSRLIELRFTHRAVTELILALEEDRLSEGLRMLRAAGIPLMDPTKKS